MKRLLGVVLILLMTLLQPISVLASVSSDEEHWASYYIEDLVFQDLVDDHSAFQPEATINRAEFIKLLVDATTHLATNAISDERPFSDVTIQDWYHDYAHVAKHMDMLGLRTADSFNPTGTVTRSEAVKAMVQAFKIEGSRSPITFADVREDHSHARYLRAAADNCIIDDDETRSFRPDDALTKGEMARMLAGATSLYCYADGTFALSSDGGGKGGCFLAGTVVTMADNTKKPIQHVVPHDVVLSFNEVTQQLEPSRVTELFVHDDTNTSYLLVNGELEVTPNHVLFLNGQWQEAGNITVGDSLQDVTGNDVIVHSVALIEQDEFLTVYNLSVEDTHTYYADGVLVHNDKGDNIGFSVGGAKDVENYRENVKKGYLPLDSDVNYEGLFYDYYFDTGLDKPCVKLFCPSYSRAVLKDPFSKEDEYYVSVGLNSNIPMDEFDRKPLNVVVVLDVSGSMSSPFDQYYYDRTSLANPEDQDSKMEVANQSLVDMLQHLRPEDRFGLVTFDHHASVLEPLQRYGDYNKQQLKKRILAIQPNGATNMEAGLRTGASLYADLELDPSYDNRIIFLTDAMPNTGYVSGDDLHGITDALARNKDIFTTFVGVGVDFNTELVEQLTKTHGANYLSVHSKEDFKHRLTDNFIYLVSPLLFDVSLEIKSDAWDIEKVYGSPKANEATGELLQVDTLFPSPSEEGEVKGGVILLKMKPKDKEGDITLIASYTDRDGDTHHSESTFVFQPDIKKVDSTGVRKAVLLTRYANLLKSWILHERRPSLFLDGEGNDVLVEYGIPTYFRTLSPWERESMSLIVSDAYRSYFSLFKEHMVHEMEKMNDTSLVQELEMIDHIIAAPLKEKIELSDEDLELLRRFSGRSGYVHSGVLELSEEALFKDLSTSMKYGGVLRYNNHQSYISYQVFLSDGVSSAVYRVVGASRNGEFEISSVHKIDIEAQETLLREYTKDRYVYATYDLNSDMLEMHIHVYDRGTSTLLAKVDTLDRREGVQTQLDSVRIVGDGEVVKLSYEIYNPYADSERYVYPDEYVVIDTGRSLTPETSSRHSVNRTGDVFIECTRDLEMHILDIRTLNPTHRDAQKGGELINSCYYDGKHDRVVMRMNRHGQERTYSYYIHGLMP